MIWVFLDLSYMAHRAMWAMKRLQFEDYPTGIIYGFFEQLRAICQDPRVNSNQIVVFVDSKKSHRLKAYPPYKRKRHSREYDKEEQQQVYAMWDQRFLLQTKILPEMGIQVVRQVGLEADDVIAYAASLQKGPVKKSVMILADSDMYQCITESNHYYDIGRKTYFNPESFKAAKNIAPERWGEVKAIAGCASDEVIGIPGVGEKTAIKYLNGSLPYSYQTHQSIISSEGQKIIKRNRPLVVLPHKKTKPFDLKAPTFDPEVFFHYCEQYGIMSYLQPKTRRGWISFFKDQRLRLRRRRANG